MKLFSLRFKLTFFISLLLFISCTITMTINYVELKSSLREIFDSQQLLFAKRLAVLNLHQQHAEPYKFNKNQLPNIEMEELNYDDDALAFAIFSTKGDMLLNDGKNGRKFVFNGGFFSKSKELAMINESHKWRILWLLSHDQRSIIAVGQKKEYQDAILANLLYSQFIPWLVTFLVVIIFIIMLIGREFSVIKQLVSQLSRRAVDDLSSIVNGKIPKEIKPFVTEINNLLARISTMILRERQFISDAAHELRTPLAALKVQTEVAQLSFDDPIAQQKALNNLNIGIDRSTHLVDQLLTLSRIDSIQVKNEKQPINLVELISSVTDELLFFAEQKQIIISFNVKDNTATMMGNMTLIRILIRNLLNNSIRYIPNKSTINIIIETQRIMIIDNGNGVTDEMLMRLGEPFYRPAGQSEEGSGLGLSIVNKIAQLHDISVKYQNGEYSGFQVTIAF